jgi:hypothetical protein
LEFTSPHILMSATESKSGGETQMNPVEIEAAVSDLAIKPFDKEDFPFAFLRTFGNKETTIKRLRSGESNKSDVGGVLQTNNIHNWLASTGRSWKVYSTASLHRLSSI